MDMQYFLMDLNSVTINMDHIGKQSGSLVNSKRMIFKITRTIVED